MSRPLILSLVVFAIIIAGCGGGGSKNNVTPKNSYVLQDNVIVIDDSNIANIKQITENTLTVANIPGITVGTVLAGGVTEDNPEGFIRIVTAMSSPDQDGNVILQTEEGMLTDIYKELQVNQFLLNFCLMTI